MDLLQPYLKAASFSVLFLVTGGSSVAQCPFDPTVTPADLILCPNSQGELATQSYDSYQWYKEGNPIPGATGQTLVVDAYNDSGSQFSVEATLADCTEMSPPVLVDGWAFLPPTVMTIGPEPLFFTQNGPIYCALDTVLLVLLQPYDINIQWTDGGVPIPGATDDTLAVYTAGTQFNVSGAPSICPDFVQDAGLWLWIGFMEPTQPTISQNGSELCAGPTGEGYQWYLDGQPIPNSDTPCIEFTQAGSYVADVSYFTDCSVPSEPFIITGVRDLNGVANWRAYPVPATDQVTVTWHDGSVIPGWRLFDATGRTVAQGKGAMRSPLAIDVSGFDAGRYWLNAGGSQVIPVSVVR